MEFNEDLITRAHELAGKAEAGELSLPAEIEGFPGFYVALQPKLPPVEQ